MFRLIVILFLFASCKSQQEYAEKPSLEAPAITEKVEEEVSSYNSKPIFPDEYEIQINCPFIGLPISKVLYVDYKGYRIYTCCKGCLRILKSNPDLGVNALLSRKRRAYKLSEVKK